MREAGPERSEYLRREIAGLLANPGFIDALPGFLLPESASQAPIAIVLATAARSGINLNRLKRKGFSSRDSLSVPRLPV